MKPADCLRPRTLTSTASYGGQERISEEVRLSFVRLSMASEMDGIRPAAHTNELFKKDGNG
jgi:hypothetical protein